MSIRDAKILVEDSTGLFAFLPAVNYFYLFNQDSSNIIYIMGVAVGLLASAFAYNYSTGSPDKSPVWIQIIFLLVILGWGILFISSVCLLYPYLNSDRPVPGILFFVSSSFASLLITHIVIDVATEGYTQDY